MYVHYVQGFNSDDFVLFPGYPSGFPSSIAPNGNPVMEGPQTRAHVRKFFGCPTLRGAEFILEDGGSSHWSERIFNACSLTPVIVNVSINSLLAIPE